MKNLKFRLLRLSINCCLRIRFYFGIYLLLLKTLEFYNKNSNKTDFWQSSPWKNDSLLVFDKTGLMEDLTTVLEFSKSDLPKLVVIPRYVVNLFAEYFLDERQRQDFLPNDEYDSHSHAQYRKLWNRLLPKLSRKFKSRLLITANYTYGNQRDIYEIATENGIGVCVLLKECFMSEANSRNRIRLFSNSRPFIGAKLLVYNASEIERQVASGNAQLEQISVTGSPRFDSLIATSVHKINLSNAKVVFFPQDYISESSFWQLSEDQIAFSKHHNNQIQFGLDAMLSLAERYPRLSFEIKSKITLATRDFIDRWQKERKIPENLKLVLGGGLARKSLENCIGAFGFNTTALVDALATGAKIAVLRHKIDPRLFADFLVDFEVAEIVYEYTDLENWVLRLISSANSDGEILLGLSDADRRCLESAVGNRDAKSSLRVIKELKLLDNSFHETDEA
jgi:hypothetical protein